MKHQRGIAEGWLILVVLVVVGAALGVAAHRIDSNAYARGKNEIEAKYAKRDNDALTAANARIQALQTSARAAEAAAANRIAAIAAQRERDISNGKAQRDRDLAAVRTGALGLRDPGATAGAACSDRSAGPQAAAGAGVVNGPAPGGLSRSASEFLFGLVDDADELAHQLASAQAVIIADRAACNAP